MEQSLLTRRLLIVAGVLGVITLAALVRPHQDRVAGHAFAIPSADDRILVEVLNGTAKQGLARLGTRKLRRQGLDVVFFGNSDKTSDSTLIIARRGAEGPADRVREALGVGTVKMETDTLRRVDVTVILGGDFRPEEDGRP
ncbi:MAG TPA: LytR C-terminal domain-containing protein [Gemmatimonadales bacterium]